MEQYSKFAATIAASLKAHSHQAIVLTSSNSEADCYDAAKKLCTGMAQLHKNTLLIDARLGNSLKATEKDVEAVDGISIKKLLPSPEGNVITSEYVPTLLDVERNRFDACIICTDSINQVTAPIFFAAESNGVILVEKKKASRTDEIDTALETIRDVGATPIGFILIG